MKKGRVFLQTDGGSQPLDRRVKREAIVSFYPTSTTGDVPIEVDFLTLENGHVKVTVVSRDPVGNRALLADVTVEQPPRSE